MSKQFRGLTYLGVPLVFDSEPETDVGYLVYLTPKQFKKAQQMGIDLHWLRPSDADDRAYVILNE